MITVLQREKIFTQLATVNIALERTIYTILRINGNRENNTLEIRTYIKGRIILGIKQVDIHSEVCDICMNGQMSYRSVCRQVARFYTGYEHLKDANAKVALQQLQPIIKKS